MNDFSNQDMLEFDVTDFGPIIKAKVDMRPLMVFIGPSNTGKSYLAILIYALHRHFSASGHRHFSRKYQMRWRSKLPRGTIDALVEFMKKEFAENEEPPMGRKVFLPHMLTDSMRDYFEARAHDLGYEIGRCFGLGDLEALIRKGTSNSAQIGLRKYFSEGSAPIESKITIKSHETEFGVEIPENLPITINDRYGYDRELSREFRHLYQRAKISENLNHEMKDFLGVQSMKALGDLTLPSILGPLQRPAFYLPADRTGVMHAHNVVVSALIENAAMAGLRPAVRSPMLSGVLADFLEQLIELDGQPYPPHKSRDVLGKTLEEDILRGSVNIDRSKGGYPRFTYKPKGWKDDLPLMNASSMVSELAPVVLYLRHMVRDGNLLIIEEPESHLHPGMQVVFTRQIAALVNSGIRVIVTTHSEWLLEELANIVQRSRLSETGENSASDSEISLRPDQVGVWLFQPKNRPKGSVVKEIGFGDSGFYPSDFEEVAMALHNEWADVSSQIGDAE